MAARKPAAPEPTAAGEPRKLATTVVLSDPASFQPLVLLEGDELPEHLADQVGEHALVPQAEAKAAAKSGDDK